MINIDKCLEFISLQKEINEDIRTTGETSPWKAAQLDLLVMNITGEESDWILDTWEKVL
jgi:hypothetical protein